MGSGKQADRNAKKAAKRTDNDEPAGANSGGDLKERISVLVMNSCIVETLPQLKDLLQPADKVANGKTEEKENRNGNGKAEEKEDTAEQKDEDQKESNGEVKNGDAAAEVFATLGSRLTWINLLGLGDPVDGDAAMKAWLEFKSLEVDWGPRAKSKGTPAMDRIASNVPVNLPQYLHILLALMVLRAFLFRSWFACLPWLVVYQVLSLLIPTSKVEKLPEIPYVSGLIPTDKVEEKLSKIPLDEIPLKFRAAGTLAIHTLMWLFFLREVVWMSWFFEKFLLVGLFAFHAYAVRPFGK